MANSIISNLASNPTIFIFLRKILENNFKGEKEVINKYFSVAPNERLLDIGCGTGEFSVFFRPDNYTGVDIVPAYINYARRHYGRTFVVGDGTMLPWPVENFDKALIIGVLHHLDDVTSLKILDEAHRVLKKGGQLLLMEDLAAPNDNILTKFVHRLDQGDFIRDRDSYRQLVERSQFAITESFRISSGLCPYQVYLLNKA